MTTTVNTPVTPTPAATRSRARWSTDRKTAFYGGLFYLITFASSIPAMFLLSPVLDDPNYILSGGADTQVTLASMLDLVNALTAVATAVVLWRVVKRQYETLALGFVTTRLFEAAVIVIGVTSILTVVSLRNPEAAGAEADSLMTVGESLVATYDWTFLLGPNIMAALNALMLATIMFKSGLVPRVIPAMGLVGAPAAPRRLDRHDLRPHRPRLTVVGRRRADLLLGVVPRCVPGRQGLQDHADHAGSGRGSPAHRLLTDQVAAGPIRARPHSRPRKQEGPGTTGLLHVNASSTTPDPCRQQQSTQCSLSHEALLPCTYARRPYRSPRTS